MCSRKLSSLKHRLVVVPSLHALGGEGDEEAIADPTGLPDRESNRGFVYWHWAFESPHEVKVLVRQVGLFSPGGSVFTWWVLAACARTVAFFHSAQRRTC